MSYSRTDKAIVMSESKLYTFFKRNQTPIKLFVKCNTVKLIARVDGVSSKGGYITNNTINGKSS